MKKNLFTFFSILLCTSISLLAMDASRSEEAEEPMANDFLLRIENPTMAECLLGSLKAYRDYNNGVPPDRWIRNRITEFSKEDIKDGSTLQTLKLLLKILNLNELKEGYFVKTNQKMTGALHLQSQQPHPISSYTRFCKSLSLFITSVLAGKETIDEFLQTESIQSVTDWVPTEPKINSKVTVISLSKSELMQLAKRDQDITPDQFATLKKLFDNEDEEE